MNAIEKIKKEFEKNKSKIADIQKKAKASVAEVQKKIKALEAQLVEEENLQIVQMVKTVNLDNKELTAFLKAYAKGDIVLPDEYKAELKKVEGENNTK